jgi:hypothetical protein
MGPQVMDRRIDRFRLCRQPGFDPCQAVDPIDACAIGIRQRGRIPAQRSERLGYKACVPASAEEAEGKAQVDALLGPTQAAMDMNRTEDQQWAAFVKVTWKAQIRLSEGEITNTQYNELMQEAELQQT